MSIKLSAADFFGAEDEAGANSKFKKASDVVDGGYELVCVNAENTTSKGGLPMLVLKFDILSGEFAGVYSKYPMTMYQTYNTPFGKMKLREVFGAFYEQNKNNERYKATFHENYMEDCNFEELDLIGLTVGGVLGYKKDNPQYLEVKYLTTVERALKAPTKGKPASKDPTTEEELPF